MAQAEAYEILAVSLSAEGKEGKNDGGNEVGGSIYPINTYCQHTLLAHLINTPLQHPLSTYLSRYPVNLPYPLPPSTQVNFGALRVGDYATQILSIGNKGKYKIGYRFLFIRPAMSKVRGQ